MSACLLTSDLDGLHGGSPSSNNEGGPSSIDAGAGDSGPGTSDGGDSGVPVVLGRSCRELVGKLTTDSFVRLDPDGDTGPEPPFDAYCEMTTEGGGWMLVARSIDNRGGGNFGWKRTRGDVRNDNDPYSMGPAAFAVGFTEILLARRANDADKSLGENLYKLTISAADLNSHQNDAFSSYAIAGVRGNCNPNNGPTMLRFAGYSNEDDFFFFRDHGELSLYGFRPDGFNTNFGDCGQGGRLQGTQGMLFVR